MRFVSERKAEKTKQPSNQARWKRSGRQRKDSAVALTRLKKCENGIQSSSIPFSTARKGSVLAAKAVKTQGKGGVLPSRPLRPAPRRSHPSTGWNRGTAAPSASGAPASVPSPPRPTALRFATAFVSERKADKSSDQHHGNAAKGREGKAVAHSPCWRFHSWLLNCVAQAADMVHASAHDNSDRVSNWFLGPHLLGADSLGAGHHTRGVQQVPPPVPSRRGLRIARKGTASATKAVEHTGQRHRQFTGHTTAAASCSSTTSVSSS